MSNYYYEEKPGYLAALAEVRRRDHDLTPFLVFGLRGIALQAQRLLAEIRHQVAKELYRNLVVELHERLKTPKKRMMAKRQVAIVNLLLDSDSMTLAELMEKTGPSYGSLKSARKTLLRDLNTLVELGAVAMSLDETGSRAFKADLEWPTKFTETPRFESLKKLPLAKTSRFLRGRATTPAEGPPASG